MAQTLLSLPGEIQNEIVSHLDGPGMLFLAATCRHFRQSIPRLDVEQLIDLVETSDMARKRDAFVCCGCGYLRHRSKFWAQLFLDLYRHRHCFPCEVYAGNSGCDAVSHYMFEGKRHVFCLLCRRLGLVTLRSSSAPVGSFDNRVCQTCWEPYAEKIKNGQGNIEEYMQEITMKGRRIGKEQRRRQRRGDCYLMPSNHSLPSLFTPAASNSLAAL